MARPLLSDVEKDFYDACGLLVFGEYERGFRLFERRLDCPNPSLWIDPEQRWDGTPGKRVLVLTEGGMGDAVLFSRYLPLVKQRSKRVGIYTGHFPLQSLYDPEDIADPRDPQWEMRVSIQSLPSIFKTTKHNVPPPFKIPTMPYQRMGDIGVRWAGNPHMSSDLARSIPLDIFKRLFKIQGVNFVSLHETRERHGVIDVSVHLRDLQATASIIAKLDLVITVDTAIAHIAASLGIPTWVLLPRIEAYWIWGLDGQTTPWYPSARLIRQGRCEDWEEVVERVRQDLVGWAK